MMSDDECAKRSKPPYKKFKMGDFLTPEPYIGGGIRKFCT